MKYWVDFSGYVKVEADSEEDANNKMWNAISRTLMFPDDFTDEVWEVEGIDKAAEDIPAGDW